VARDGPENARRRLQARVVTPIIGTGHVGGSWSCGRRLDAEEDWRG
jgi:hypothetical protein